VRETATIEQSVEQARRLANHCCLLAWDRTSVTGPSAELLQSPEVTHIFPEDVARGWLAASRWR